MASLPSKESAYTQTDEALCSNNEAKQKLASRLWWSEVPESSHFVQFYETDDFLLDSLGAFVGKGLGSGEACIVIVTKAHRKDLEARLQANSLHLGTARARHQYIALDAEEMLSRFMRDNKPDPECFAQVVGEIITRAASGQRHVRVFGEMVTLLWLAGKRAAAIQVESLWNDLARTAPPFTLFCAYPMSCFAKDESSTQLLEVCQQHAHVIPDESYTTLTSPDERLRAITLWQQKAYALESEIAERKVVEEHLRISENRYRRLFETSTDGVLIVDPDTGIVTDANPAMTKLVGSSLEQMQGQYLWHIDLFADEQTTLQILQEVRVKRILRYETMPLHLKNGELRYVDFVSTIFRANGCHILQCTLRDVTERKRAEEALQQSEKTLRFMAESMPQKIFTAKPNGNIDYMNPQWMEFTGLSFEEIKNWGWVQFVHPYDVEENIRRWQHSIDTGEPFYYEHRFRRADGVYRWHVSRAIPIRDAQGHITMWIGSNTDITEQKELEYQKDVLVSITTHELKTPLTSMKGYMQLAERQLQQLVQSPYMEQTEQQKIIAQALMLLSRSQQQLGIQNRLITDLLDASRMQEGTLELHLTPCDLANLVSKTVEHYQTVYPQRQIALTLPEQALPVIQVDSDRIEQVLSNYLTNAFKYSETVIQVSVVCEAHAVRVWVADQGPGLSHEVQQHIWERFYRAPGVVAHSDTGTSLGLGLSICQGIIRSHRGQVGVESAPGQGSRFWFTLPLP